jgi:hypothetical protein
MTKFLKKLFGYWEVWHLALAPYAYIIFYNWQDGHKQKAFLLTMALALLWELGEWAWQSYKKYEAYGGSGRAFFVNSMKDMLAALLASLACTFLMQ